MLVVTPLLHPEPLLPGDAQQLGTSGSPSGRGHSRGADITQPVGVHAATRHPAPQGPAGISPALSPEPPLRISAVPSAPQAGAGGARGVSQTIGMRHWGLKGTGFIFNRVHVLS